MRLSRRSVGVLAMLAAGCGGAFAQPSGEDRIKPLLVMISAQFDNASKDGAGIIIDHNVGRLYVVTANHVVREGPREAKSVKVRFHWLPGESFEAKLADNFDVSLDVAVLVVADAARLHIPALPFEALGDTTQLRREHRVHSIGYPRATPWFSRPSPDIVASASTETIQFEAAWIGPGYSGGGLFNDRWQLVGLIQRDDPPIGEAMPVERLFGRLRQWGYNVRFGAAAAVIPPTSAPSAPAPSAPAPSAKPPSATDAATPGWSNIGFGYNGNFTCAVSRQREAYCWGNNAFGQLGSSGGASNVPRKVELPPGVQAGVVYVAASHACALTSERLAYCWGSNSSGQASGVEETITAKPRLLSDSLKFRTLALGNRFSCGLISPDDPKTRGESDLYCWGNNSLLGVRSRTPVRKENMRFVTIRGGLSILCGTKEDGAVYCIGSGETNKKLTIGSLAMAALPVRVSLPEPANSVVGGPHSCAVGRSGTGYCWGQNLRGELGLGKAAPPSDGSPAAISGRSDFAFIYVGVDFTCGRTRDGIALCWGSNQSGTLGNGTTVDSSAPVQISSQENFFTLYAGAKHVCGLTRSQKILCWGDNTDGQLGNGTNQMSLTPVEVPPPR